MWGFLALWGVDYWLLFLCRVDKSDLLLFEVCQWLDYDYVGLLLLSNMFLIVIIETVEYLIRLDDVVHFPLKVKILITPDGLIIFCSDTVQFYQFHNNLWWDLMGIEFELYFAIKKLVCELWRELGLWIYCCGSNGHWYCCLE